MNIAHRRIVLGAALAVVAIVSNITPASAMGRSTTPTVQRTATAVINDRPARAEFAGNLMEMALDAQVAALRQQLADLEAQVSIMQGLASAE